MLFKTYGERGSCGVFLQEGLGVWGCGGLGDGEFFYLLENVKGVETLIVIVDLLCLDV